MQSLFIIPGHGFSGICLSLEGQATLARSQAVHSASRHSQFILDQPCNERDSRDKSPALQNRLLTLRATTNKAENDL